MASKTKVTVKAYLSDGRMLEGQHATEQKSLADVFAELTTMRHANVPVICLRRGTQGKDTIFIFPRSVSALEICGGD